MKRGSLITVALSGHYGKPRPALIVQSDFFDSHPSVTILPITSEIRDAPLFRVTVEPSKENGLKNVSQVMIDKAHTIPQEKVGRVLGQMDYKIMTQINRSLALFLGFG